MDSYLVSVGEVIAVKEKSRGSEKIKAIIEANSGKKPAGWLDMNWDTLEAKVVAVPKKEDIADLDIAEHLIVELYSK